MRSVTKGCESEVKADLPSPPATTRPADWWTLLLIVLCYGFYNLDKTLLSILIEPIKAEFMLSDTQMGLLTGMATSVPFAIACIPVGLLADRRNRRNILALLVAGWSLVTGLTSLARSVTALFLTRVGIGAFEAGFTPVSLSMLSDLFPARLRSTVMGVFSLGAPIGLFMGMAAGGIVEETHGWRTAFLLAGLPGLVLAGLLLLTTREPARGHHEALATEPARKRFRAVLGNMWSNRALLHISIGMTWCASTLAVFAVWTPSLLRRSFEMTASEAGLWSGITVGIGGALGAAIGGMLSDRVGRDSQWRKLIVPVCGTTLSAGLGSFALLAAADIALVLVCLGAATFFGQFYIGSCYGLAATLAGSSLRAATLAVLLVLFNLLSYSAGSGIVGWMSDMLRAEHGGQALRLAYAGGMIFNLAGLCHLLLAMGRLRGPQTV